MKKTIVLIFLLICFVLTGCGSDAKYEDLEKRVSELEKRWGKNEQNSLNDEHVDGKEMVTPKEESSGVAPYEATTEDFYYYLDDMSDKEVVLECQYYFSNIPAKGESFENYYKTFLVKPERTSVATDFGVYCTYNSEPNDHDIITQIVIGGLQAEMDGSIGYSDKYFTVMIDMTIQEYNKAANIYAMLYDDLTEDKNLKVERDNRNSTNWSCYGFYDGHGVEFLTMSKGNDGFRLKVFKYIRNNR